MKPLYRTAFQLERVGEPLNAIHEIAQVCLDWVFLHRGAPKKGILRPESLGPHAQDFPATAIGEGRKLETRYWKGAAERLWALRLTHPDDKDSGIEWCVELTLECSSAGVKFTCAQAIKRRDLEAGILDRRASQPGIIPRLVERYGAVLNGVRLASEPWGLGSSGPDCARLKSFLLHPLRYPFIVFISPDSKHGPLVDPGLWARKLSTLALVVVAEDDQTTRRWEAELGDPLFACWGGAIRIYRPGFTLADDPVMHPYYPPYEVRDILTQMRDIDFADLMVARLASEATYQGHGDFRFWPELSERINQHRLAELSKTSVEEGELAKLYATEVDSLTAELDQAKQALTGLQQEVNALREWKVIAQRAHRQIRAHGTTPAHALRDLPEVSSVVEAIATAERELMGQLVFHLNSKSEPDTPFHCPTDVLYAFRWLAGPFRRSKMGHLAGVDLEQHFADYLPTWEYAPNQSKVTIGKNREWYTINYPMPKGEEPLMFMHLACGNDRKPERCIRIGFIWDAQRQVVAVGYVGRHQRNDKS